MQMLRWTLWVRSGDEDNCKYRDLSTAQRTVKLSVASVEMTSFLGLIEKEQEQLRKNG
ncbi:hypothetical protein HDF09_003326 [Edaphobacter lichenicola]|uniref:Uncharacterized protein n=1 Tax=Tunturiibacter empetritectus TaxID=3069691 RepID=A0A7W8MSQ8_9BACT|nr:hypothetical protein [Edaphobacter lichenicola]